MAINFVVGDKVIVKRDYVQNTLARLSTNPNLKRTISVLRLFGIESAEVTETGTIDVFDRGTALTRSYIKVIPQSMQNPNYQAGRGVILYFDTDTLLNNSFEYSTAYLCDICARRAINMSGVSISKFDVVRYTGFDATTQLPTIALASASSLTTNAVMGVAEEDIADGNEGSIVIEGAVSGVDTSAFLVNETAYLSDTPGAFQSTAGTTSSIVGRVHTVGNPGSISVKGELPFGEGQQGVTGVQGIQGDTGAQGFTGLGSIGATGLYGPTGIQGVTGPALGATGVQGVPGSTGIMGITGLALGSTGISGVTGVSSVEARANSGSYVGPRAKLNFIQGSNITIGVVDNVPFEEIQITITASVPATGLFGGVANGISLGAGSSTYAVANQGNVQWGLCFAGGPSLAYVGFGFTKGTGSNHGQVTVNAAGTIDTTNGFLWRDPSGGSSGSTNSFGGTTFNIGYTVITPPVGIVASAIGWS